MEAEGRSATERGITGEEAAKHAETYEAGVEKDRSKAAAKLDAELKKLAKIANEYGPALLPALEREAGGDAEAIRNGLRALIEDEDPDSAAETARELRREYGKVVERALATSKIDRKGAHRKLLAAIGRSDIAATKEAPGDAAGARLLRAELVESESIGISILPEPEPEPTPPPPAPTMTVANLAPPYPLRFVSSNDQTYARADTATGKLWAYSYAYWAGSFQTRSSVGGMFSVGSSVRRVRVEATVDQRYRTAAQALTGYASAEALVNLVVRDGSREVARDRLSLARSIAVVFWMSEATGSGVVHLACEFDRTPGTSATYSANVEAEVWAGGGGFPAAGAAAFEDVVGLNNFRAFMFT